MPSARTRAARFQEIDYSLSSFAERFLAELQTAGRSTSTLEKYKLVFTHLAAFLCEQVASDDIRSIRKERLAAYGETVMQITADSDYKATWLSRLKIFFRWALACGLILSDPAATLAKPAAKKRKHPAYLSKEETANLLDGIATNTHEGIRDRALMELMYSSGLRAPEVRKLTVNEINFAEHTVTVIKGKGGKDRIVPVGKIALWYLDHYLQTVRGFARPGPLFYNLHSGKPMARWYLRDIFAKHKQKAGIKKKCHAGIFRHSFAIHLLEGGAGIRYIAEMMGHAKLRTTQIYTQIIPKELKRVHQKSHPSERRRCRLPQVKPTRLI